MTHTGHDSHPQDLGKHLTGWAPAPATALDPLSPAPSAALAASLGVTASAPPPPGTLPPLWHWLHFAEWPERPELGPDGHPLEGGFLPPLPDRRRMFAGGRTEFHAPLRTGVPAQRHSSLAGTEVKAGRSGEMVFVTVRQEIRQDELLCLTEEQDFVYRSGEQGRRSFARDTVSEASPPEVPWQLALRPDTPLLFRFSALTANTHRIHYDSPYACGAEGYPGLVVHGPLLVLLMLETARRNVPERAVRSLSYRLRSPLFEGEHLRALGTPSDDGRTARLRIASAREERHATAEVSFQ